MTDGVILNLTQVNPPLKIKVRHDRRTEIVERCSHRDRDYGRYYPPDSASMAKTLKEQGTIAFWLQLDHNKDPSNCTPGSARGVPGNWHPYKL